ncbi:DUF927 domain-containing protein [Acinetobacter bereziniae]|uniref:DUF927 domain-containing protein n=1 Tax=Acinetobacter bereziniae TaxID=106648 RepID=UPI00124CF232|nr:DUF927 domain-containing protein [Acinetobacter bereziniae]
MSNFDVSMIEDPTPVQIIQQAQRLMPQDESYLTHPVLERFGNPQQPIYVDQSNVDINGVIYESPMILPIYNGQLELVQCAVLQDKQSIAVIPDGLAQGFSYYGELDHNKPVIITYSLDAYFKIAQTGCAVVLVILPHLCYVNKSELKAFDFEQIQFVIHQLSKAGYTQLYIPVRPEHIQLEAFQKLEKNTPVKLLNQLVKFENNEHFIDLVKDDNIEDVQAFITESIALLPKLNPIPKGHLAKPMKWDNGFFHVLKDGVFFIEQDKNGNESKRFISSPVLVKAKTRDDSSNNWGVLLEWFDDNNVKHTQAISMELFQTDGADLRKALSYQGVTIAPTQHARNLLQCYLMSYSTGKYALCVDRVGWHGDVFVLPHKQIGQRNDSDLIVYQANHGLDNRYQSKGTLEHWRTTVAQLVQNHSLLVFSLCTAFAGQLLDDLHQQGGGFHLKGKSSKGKSTALYLACSVWGNPKQFYRTWRATGNALEHTAYMHNDSFLVLDEIGEIANPKEIGTIVYMLANGLGKGRMTKQITAKPMHQWKIIFLSSGEKSLKDIMQEQGQKTKLGQEIRLSDIDIDQNEYGIFDQIDFAEDGAKQSIELINRLNDCYGVAGIAWLEYLTGNKQQIIDQARELFDQYRNALTFNQDQGHIKRVASYFALVAVAGELASLAKITGWNTGTAFNAVQTVFNQWLNGFEKVGDYEDREILAHVKAFFEANENSRFEAVTPDTDHIERINNRVGYWKIENGEKVFYVLLEQFKNEICKGFDSRKVAKVLLSNELLEHDIGKNTKAVRLPSRSKVMRVYVIKESILSLDIDNLMGNKGNMGNTLENKGFEAVTHTQNEKVTKVTPQANEMGNSNLLPLLPNEIKKGNSLKANDSNVVTSVTFVTSTKQVSPDSLETPQTLKEEKPVAKMPVKVKQSVPEKIDSQTIDMFEGGL